MRFAFHTSICPEWEWSVAIGAAIELGFDGIEWEPTSKVRVDAANIGTIMAEAGLSVPSLDADVLLPIVSEGDWGGLQQTLETAACLRAERVVVTAEGYPETMSESEAVGRFSEALRTAAELARAHGVRIAVSLRNTLDWDRTSLRARSTSAFVRDSMRRLENHDVGVQWNLALPYGEGERVDQTWDNIHPWFSYLQLVDIVRGEAGWRQTVLGTGEVPVAFALAYVGGTRYDGWTCLNLDRRTYPELGDPRDLLAGFKRFVAGVSAEVGIS